MLVNKNCSGGWKYPRLFRTDFKFKTQHEAPQPETHRSAQPTAQMLSQKERGASLAKPEKKEDNKAQKSATAKVVGAAAPNIVVKAKWC